MNSAILTRERSFAVLVAALSLLACMTYAGEPTALTNGVAVTGISGAANSEMFYKIDVPAGQDTLQISTSGGTGDVDLYVRRGSQPTTTSYDYRPYKVGNDETVDVNNPAAGTWYIMLRGYSSYSGVTLKAAYSAATSIKVLTNGVPATGLSAPPARSCTTASTSPPANPSWKSPCRAARATPTSTSRGTRCQPPPAMTTGRSFPAIMRA